MVSFQRGKRVLQNLLSRPVILVRHVWFQVRHLVSVLVLSLSLSLCDDDGVLTGVVCCVISEEKKNKILKKFSLFFFERFFFAANTVSRVRKRDIVYI